MSRRTAIAVLACAAVFPFWPGSAAGQSPNDFTNWTSAASNAASGSLHGTSVELSAGPGVVSPAPTSVVDGTSDVFNRSDFTPPLPASDAITFVGSSGYSYTLDFGAAIKDPVLHLGSLASTLTFPTGTEITRVSGDAQFSVTDNTVVGGLEAPTDDANGTVRLNGTFTSLEFTTTFPGSDGIYLQVGNEPPAPPPPPSGGGGGSAPAPFIKAMGRVTVPGAPRLGAVTAQITGPYSTLYWSVNGSPPLKSRPGQDTILFRLRPASSEVTVRAVGPGGSSALSRFNIGGITQPRGRTAERIEAKTGKNEVRLIGARDGVIGGAISRLCIATGPPQRLYANNGLLDVQGRCLRKIKSIGDLRDSERGIVVDMAKQYRIPLKEGDVNLGLDLSDAYLTYNQVRVNGVDIDPVGSDPVVIFPQAGFIASPNAQMSVGGLKLGNPRRFEMSTKPVGGAIRFPTMPALNGSALLRGFNFFGDVNITGNAGGASINANVQLPAFFNIGGGPSSASISMRATTDQGLVLDSLHIGPLGTFVGPIKVEEFKIDYTGGNEQRWNGQGRACLPFGGCINMVPPNGGVRLIHGGLDYIGASLPLRPPVTLFPGLDMDEIGFGFGLNPTRFLVNPVDLRVLRLLKIDARMVVAFPGAGDNYTLEHDAAYLEPDPAHRRFPAQFYGVRRTGFTAAVSGAVAVVLPVFGDVPLGGGYFLYEHPGYLAFGGGVNVDLLGIGSVEGGVNGELNVDNGRYDLHGGVKACLGICAGGDFHVSSRGLSVCARPPVIPDFGVGVYWPARIPQDWSIQLGGCRWSPYREKNVRGSAHSAQTGSLHTFTIDRGDPTQSVRLLSATGAPRVRIVGPGGEVLDSPTGDGPVARGSLMAVRLNKLHQTAVGAIKPTPGTYRVETLPGSPPVISVAVSRGLPEAKVSAKVRGRGSRRVLTYKLRKRAGQRVRFVDQTAGGASRMIKTVGAAKGRIAFSPAPGVGRHKVIAQFELNGLPAERKTVASFKPPAPYLGRARGLKLKRRGARLRVSWKRVREAAAYEVVVTPTGGRQRRIRTRRASVSLKVARTSSGRVTVRAVDRLRHGRVARKRFRATAKHKGFKKLPRAPRLKK